MEVGAVVGEVDPKAQAAVAAPVQLESQGKLIRVAGLVLEAAGLRPRIVSTGNPGSIGHLWVKARFVDPAPPGPVPRRHDAPEVLALQADLMRGMMA